MTIKQIHRAGETELLVEGRLDSTTAPEAEEIFLKAAQETESLILNIAGLQYVSSAGLRVFKRVYMTTMQHGTEFYLKNTPRTVMEVLEMTGFSGILKFR